MIPSGKRNLYASTARAEPQASMPIYFQILFIFHRTLLEARRFCRCADTRLPWLKTKLPLFLKRRQCDFAGTGKAGFASKAPMARNIVAYGPGLWPFGNTCTTRPELVAGGTSALLPGALPVALHRYHESRSTGFMVGEPGFHFDQQMNFASDCPGF